MLRCGSRKIVTFLVYKKTFSKPGSVTSNLECDEIWRKCDVTSFRHCPSLKPRSSFWENSDLERPWLLGLVIPKMHASPQKLWTVVIHERDLPCMARVRGKRRGFSPGAAVRHSPSAAVHTETNRRNLSTFSFPIFWIESALARLWGASSLVRLSGETQRKYRRVSGIRPDTNDLYGHTNKSKWVKHIYSIHERTHAPLHAHPDAHMPSHVCPLSRLLCDSLWVAFWRFLSLTYICECVYIYTHVYCTQTATALHLRPYRHERRATHERLARLAKLPDTLSGWRISCVAVWKAV